MSLLETWGTLKTEIEALRTENERLRLDARAYANVMLSEENDALIEENKELRKSNQRYLIGITQLQEENDRLKALINDKQYIQLLADYNRGHLSHYSSLKQRDGGIREPTGPP